MANRHGFVALRQALAPACLRRSLVVALVIGTVLTAINQGDRLLADGELNVFKLVLTYVVPSCVATYGACSMARHTAHAPAHPALEDEPAYRRPQ